MALFCEGKTFLLVALTFLVALPWEQVELCELNGSVANVELTSILEGKVTVVERGGMRQLAHSEVHSLVFARPKLQAHRGASITLVDGTQIFGSSFQLQNGRAQVGLDENTQCELASSVVANVQLQDLTDVQQTQWQAITSSAITADMLVIIRSPESLDKIEGVVQRIDDEAVQFDFDGQIVNAPRAKLAGVRFYSKPKTDYPELKAVVEDRLGGIWRASDLSTVDESTVQVELQGGQSVTLPRAMLAKIDFSVGSMKYLAQIEPLQQQIQSQFGFKQLEGPLNSLFGMHVIEQRVIPGQAPEPELEFLGRGKVTYRVPQGFQRMVGRIQMRPKGEQFTPSRLIVAIEEKVIWQQELTDRSVYELDLQVQPENRLTFEIASTTNLALGDVVVFQGLKFTK